MRRAVVIPARYGSTRFPGKPLAKIAGETMLSRVVAAACAGCARFSDCVVVVATDDERISRHCADLGVRCIMTPAECPTGSDRVFEALQRLDERPDFVVNLQGDAVLTPADYIERILDEAGKSSSVEVITPVVSLSWEALDQLRRDKQSTPFSGTCAVINRAGEAIWFSKQIIPAIRNEVELRRKEERSPVYRHIGLYGYSVPFLEQYVTWEMSPYEKLEGLEQLRILENGHTIRCVEVDDQKKQVSFGVDTPEDVTRVEKLLQATVEG